MNVLVCGSRNWEDTGLIYEVLLQLPARSNIIHGGAKGADSIAGSLAPGFGHTVQVVRAEWEKYGKRAGYLRNKKMVDMQPDLVIAFTRGTRGTQHTIDLARAAGIEVRVYGGEYGDDGF